MQMAGRQWRPLPGTPAGQRLSPLVHASQSPSERPQLPEDHWRLLTRPSHTQTHTHTHRHCQVFTAHPGDSLTEKDAPSSPAQCLSDHYTLKRWGPPDSHIPHSPASKPSLSQTGHTFIRSLGGTPRGDGSRGGLPAVTQRTPGGLAGLNRPQPAVYRGPWPYCVPGPSGGGGAGGPPLTTKHAGSAPGTGSGDQDRAAVPGWSHCAIDSQAGN